MKFLDTNIVTKETLSYVKKFSGFTILIKLGGSVLEDNNLIKNLAIDLGYVRAAGISIVLVHGGGKAIDKELKLHGIESSFYEGLRITTNEMIKIIEMVLCGHVNKLLVRELNASGIPAVGLSGSDNNMFVCDPFSAKHQNVGQIKAVNSAIVETILHAQDKCSEGMIPIIAPIGITKNGNALNINADWAACYLAHALKIKKLIYITDQNGINDNAGKLISKLSVSDLQQLIQNQVVKDGMLTKAKAIVHAIQQGISDIHIINGKTPHALLNELFTQIGIGTIITTEEPCYEN
jgi:acetylglutamate kinase